MPYIHIKSLPCNNSHEVSNIIEAVTRDFARETGIDLEHITATWEFFPPGHYADAGQTVDSQPQGSHPVLVDLLTPDFNSTEKVQQMLVSVASSISRRARIPIDNIFINHRNAHSGRVFDAGEIVKW